VPGIAGDYSQLTGFCGIQGFLPEQQTEMGISFYTPMTADTSLIENRLYLGAKINFLLVTSCKSENGRSRMCSIDEDERGENKANDRAELAL